MTLPRGTLVQIVDDAVPLNPAAEVRRMVANHGYLWLIDEPIHGIQNGVDEPIARQWYRCKALSSGMIYYWNEDEFKVAEGGDDAHPAG